MDGVMKLAAGGQRFPASHQLRPQAGQAASGRWAPRLGERGGLTHLRCPFSRRSSLVSGVAAAQCGEEGLQVAALPAEPLQRAFALLH